MKKITFFLLAFACMYTLSAQEAFQTFKDRRIINAHSVETLAKRKLDIRITHRFGDFAGDNGGFQTFFGLENAADVLIGAEYGVTDALDVGISRAKGIGSLPNGKSGLRQLVNGFVKYQILKQRAEGGSPITLTVLGVSSVSTAKKSTIVSNISSFPNFTDRMAFSTQVLIAKKFSEGFAMQITPAYTYRNLVDFNDVNGIFSIGFATRIQLTKIIGLIADITLPFSEDRTSANGFYPSIGIGFEFDTGGHIFQVNFTNSTAIMETDYIPYTTSNWGDGAFRLGFTISRLFNL